MFIRIPAKRYSLSRGRNGAPKIIPCIGSIVYTGMVYGVAEHSGVYVGNGKIVELKGDGNINKVSAYEFMQTPLQGRPEILKALAAGALHVAGKSSLATMLGAVPLDNLASDCWKIYVSCKGGQPVGSQQAAQRALDMVGGSRDYNLILDNCHQFCSGCLTGNFENSDNFLWMLKYTAEKTIGTDDDWRVWDR